MYRFLFTRGWLAVSVFALLAIPFCVFMGSWQLSRFEVRVDQHKSAQHDQRRTAAEAPVPLNEVLPDTRTALAGDDSGRIVTATGRYDTGHQFLVPGRTLDDHNGFYVLTPLRVAGGGALPVVRGWLPGDASAAQRSGTVPAAPAGQVTVVGAAQYPETTDTGEVRTGLLPAGQLGMISAASLVNVLPYPVYGGWITASHPASPLQAVPPAAPPNSGLDLKAFQNLGYTGQWFVFAGFVVFMWFRLVRREAEARSDAALGLVPEEELPDGEGPAAGDVPEREGETGVPPTAPGPAGTEPASEVGAAVGKESEGAVPKAVSSAPAG
ncbi:SURF1 family protein [Actinacidiphila sp. ITFR-21]|uniref:SURF1 family protein n=1 Tax=Actinacidiphila sp. ITFR-21 TaxID=3075199 RepID=UPI0028899292|nr:SURF1 family protein [Streptomyces sp. ITFR-21]WNI16371.1 SURF1 family protein [Streptomyces sp. ITFR-21]